MKAVRITVVAAALLMGTNAVSAQSASELLAVPPNPVAYYETLLEARRLIAAKNPSAAEPLAERLTREYPRDGENWILLAGIKRSLGKFNESAEAYERAGPLLGWGVWHIARINSAVNHLAAGNKRAALDVLKKAVFEDRGLFRVGLYDWQGLEALKEDPEFLEIVGRVNTKGWTRNEGWTRDVDHLMTEFTRVHPEYRYRPLPAEMTLRIAQLKADIPKLTDEQIFVGMGRILSVLRQGHIGVFAAAGSRQLPVQLYVFPEGVFIVNARDPHKSLIGSRVVAIENTPADEALRRVNETYAMDGIMKRLWIGPHLMVLMPYLNGLDIAPSKDTVTLKLAAPNGSVSTVRLGAVPIASRPKLGPPPNAPAPLWLRDVEQAHWELAMAEHNALYVQMNQVTHDPGETLPQFGVRIRKVLADTKPKNLIIDVRHNNGGSTSNYPEFLRTVVAFSAIEGNRVYVLIGRGTYSATGNLITDLERLANVVFVGEASSECCNLYGDPARVALPYSGVSAELTNVRWNLSRNVYDERTEMSPHVPVQLTASAYFAGRDPVMETVISLLKK